MGGKRGQEGGRCGEGRLEEVGSEMEGSKVGPCKESKEENVGRENSKGGKGGGERTNQVDPNLLGIQ
jgi:hypothetical protein